MQDDNQDKHQLKFIIKQLNTGMYLYSLEYLDAKYFKRNIISQSQNFMFTYSILVFFMY